MGRTKQIPRGDASHRPGGMTTATFTSTEGQFKDTTEVDTKDDHPLVLEDAEQKPKEGKTRCK